MPGWKISGLALAEGLAGFTLLWSGLANATLRDTLTGFLRGQPPRLGSSPQTTGPPAVGVGQGSPAAAAAGGGPGSTAPAAPANVSGNVATGKLMAAAYGWGSGGQWNALYALWERESGWSNTADNASSGAYGIPQALGHGSGGAPYPASSQAANPPRYGGSSSATSQIGWGLSYIKSVYGTPEAAWAHEESAGWY